LTEQRPGRQRQRGDRRPQAERTRLLGPAGVGVRDRGQAARQQQAASAQLARLQDAGLLEVERSGRHRYYRLAAAPQVVAVLEALAPLAAAQPVRSLRQATRAAALRAARTCYDHLAGRLGVQLTQSLIDRDVLAPADGIHDTRRRPGDLLSTQLPSHPYVLGAGASVVLTSLGVPADRIADDTPARRPLLRFCLDWSEQRHHLGGRLGADLLTAFTEAGWITRAPQDRAVRLTSAGKGALRSRLGLDL
jgi:DNA-binding transcriptional ArsR family regulator